MDSASPLWPFKPNWRDAVSTGYVFKSDIFTADDGSEQRRALRSTPRRTRSFTATLTGDNLRRFNSFMDRYQAQVITMPDVLRSCVTAEPLGASGRSVRLASVPQWLTPGDAIVLVTPIGDYVRATAQGIASSVLTLADALGDFPAGTKVHPTLVGKLAQSIDTKLVTSRITEAEVVFNVQPASEGGDFARDLSDDETYQLRLDHNWSQPLAAGRSWSSGAVDFGRGRIDYFTPVAFPSSVRTYNLLLRDPTPVVDFFCRMKGQRTAFLMNDPSEDLTIAADAAGTTLLVRGTETFADYRDDPVRAAIEVVTFGAAYLRKVTGMTLAGGNTSLLLDEALPPIAARDVLRVSWVVAARFASDTLEVEHITTAAARVVVNIKTLPADTISADAIRVTTAGDLRVTVQNDQREVVTL